MRKCMYTLSQGRGDVWVTYDESADCRSCRLPVVAASVGGTDLCPWCDCGNQGPPREIREQLIAEAFLECKFDYRVDEHGLPLKPEVLLEA